MFRVFSRARLWDVHVYVKEKEAEEALTTETLRPICSRQLHKLGNCQKLGNIGLTMSPA